MKVLAISDLHWGMTKSTASMHLKWLRNVAPKLDYDVVVVLGDTQSTNLSEFKKALKHLSDKLKPGIPKLIVRGNHDYWHRGESDLIHHLNEQSAIMKTFGFIELHNSLFVNDGFLIVGWDGWYAQFNPSMMNDINFVQRYVGDKQIETFDDFLSRRSLKGFEQACDYLEKPVYKDKKKIVICHYPCFKEQMFVAADVDWAEDLKKGAYLLENTNTNLFICGHRHTASSMLAEGGVRLEMLHGHYSKGFYTMNLYPVPYKILEI